MYIFHLPKTVVGWSHSFFGVRLRSPKITFIIFLVVYMNLNPGLFYLSLYPLDLVLFLIKCVECMIKWFSFSF